MTDTSRIGGLDRWECFCDTSYFDMWCVRKVGERRFGHGFHLVNGDQAQGLCDLLSKQADRIEALDAKVERLEECMGDAYQLAGEIADEYDGNGKIERLLDLLAGINLGEKQ